MRYKIIISGCKEMLGNFMIHVNDLLDNKPFLKDKFSIDQIDTGIIAISYDSNNNDTDFDVPIITFDRNSDIVRTKDFVIDFGIKSQTPTGVVIEKIIASSVRNIMCHSLCGYKEYINSNIVVSDTFEIDGFTSGCSLVIGLETNFTAKLDFISSKIFKSCCIVLPES